MYLNDPVVIDFFGKIREENTERMTQEVASEHFPLPWPYCEADGLLHPVDGLEEGTNFLDFDDVDALEESFGVVLLQSGEQKKEDYHTKRGQVLQTVTDCAM